MVNLLQRFTAEASRIYEARTGRSIEEAPVIHNPQEAYEFLRWEMEGLEQEHLRTINLNVKNHVLSSPLIYQGSVSSAQVRVAEVFRPAIMDNASTIIIAHNHPSGDPTPSAEDTHLTKQFVEAGRMLDIDVLDHLVIGNGTFVSMRERGQGFAG